MIKDIKSQNHVITYDDQTNQLLEMEDIILSKKDEFIKRGCAVVYSFYRNYWIELVKDSLQNNIWYNGAIIEAALQCMEDLTLNGNVSRTYELINIQNNSCVFLDMELSCMQNSSITNIIGTFHELGKEFVDYRNFYIDSYKTKQK